MKEPYGTDSLESLRDFVLSNWYRILLFMLLAFLCNNIAAPLAEKWKDADNKQYVLICQEGQEVQRIKLPVFGKKVVEFPVNHQGKAYVCSLEILSGAARISKVTGSTFPDIPRYNKEWIRRSDEFIQIDELNIRISFIG